MPFDRPPLTQLRDNVLADVNGARVTTPSGTVLAALLQKAILRVIAYAQAGLSYEHYGYLDWIAQMAIPWTAQNEFLDGWAALKGIYRKAATATTGTVTFSGASQGIDVPQGTGLTRSDGALFVTTADAQTGSGLTVTVDIQASVAGSAGNFDANTVFLLSNPITGILAQSTASSQTVAGADVEIDTALRTRMLAAYAAPPQGGDLSDYIEWALAVTGVTRAWVSPNGLGAGTVNVFVMLDDAESAHNGFPQGSNGVATYETRATAATGDQLTVANALFAKQPVTALVYSTAPTAQSINFTINNLGTNNTTPIQNQITAALTDMFLELGNVGGTINPDGGAAWPAIDPSSWYEAIGAISGLTQFTVSAPSSPITAGSGELPVLGTITFNT